jgi:hypothetical protein
MPKAVYSTILKDLMDNVDNVNKLLEKIARIPLPVRQWGLFAAWIGSLILIGCLLWGLTDSFRSRLVLTSANKALESSDIPYRLDKLIYTGGRPLQATRPRLGSWFTLRDAEGKAVVFPLMAGTDTAAVLALLSPGGKVESFVPLSANAKQLFGRLPAGTVQLYIRRAEEACALLDAPSGEEGQ